MYNSR